MAFDCPDNNKIGAKEAEALNKIPLLRYQKDPVLHKEDLWIKFPQGGEYGWYAFVISDKTFAYWDKDTKDWELLSSGDLQSLLGVDISILKDGDVPVWNAEKGEFVIVSSNLWGEIEW